MAQAAANAYHALMTQIVKLTLAATDTAVLVNVENITCILAAESGSTVFFVSAQDKAINVAESIDDLSALLSARNA